MSSQNARAGAACCSVAAAARSCRALHGIFLRAGYTSRPLCLSSSAIGRSLRSKHLSNVTAPSRARAIGIFQGLHAASRCLIASVVHAHKPQAYEPSPSAPPRACPDPRDPEPEPSTRHATIGFSCVFTQIHAFRGCIDGRTFHLSPAAFRSRFVQGSTPRAPWSVSNRARSSAMGTPMSSALNASRIMAKPP